MSNKLYEITIREKDGLYETYIEYFNHAADERGYGGLEYAGGGRTPYEALFGEGRDIRSVILDKDFAPSYGKGNAIGEEQCSLCYIPWKNNLEYEGLTICMDCLEDFSPER